MMIFWMLLACSGDSLDTGETAEVVDPSDWAVDAAGPYNAGHRSVELSFPSMIDGRERTINVHAWYPTLDTEGEDVSYIGFYQDSISLGNATPAPAVHTNGYPVQIYSHGNTMFGGDAAHMHRRFASHGWVVLATDHTDNMLTDSVDGDIPTSVYIHRPQDLSEALDWLEGLDASDALSQANADQVLVNGHSRGCDDVWFTMGSTVDPDSMVSACERMDHGACSEEEMAAFLSGDLSDERMVAGITMAGTINRKYHGDDGHLSVRGPVLLMSGSNDSGHAVSESFETLTGIERTLLDIEGACHGSFNVGLCDTLDADRGYQIVQTYALAFGRHHVLDDDDSMIAGILDGTIVVDEAAGLTFGN